VTDAGIPDRTTGPDLASVVAREVAKLLDAVEIGSPLQVGSASSVCPVLERLVPQVLAARHSEWGSESLDGFYFSHAVRTGSRSAEFAGTCILISDQAMTPFRMNFDLSDKSTMTLRIRLGEPLGNGPLGISGPPWGSSAARELLSLLDERLDIVDWVYDEAFTTGDGGNGSDRDL
jgi:hypothetical protein